MGKQKQTVKQKQVPLSATLNSLQSTIKEGFSDLGNRVAALEKSDADTNMRIRDLEIKMRAAKGESHVSIAQSVDLHPSRISQIVNN